MDRRGVRVVFANCEDILDCRLRDHCLSGACVQILEESDLTRLDASPRVAVHVLPFIHNARPDVLRRCDARGGESRECSAAVSGGADVKESIVYANAFLHAVVDGSAKLLGKNPHGRDPRSTRVHLAISVSVVFVRSTTLQLLSLQSERRKEIAPCRWILKAHNAFSVDESHSDGRGRSIARVVVAEGNRRCALL